tara:strand:- start:2393 stop:2599 length:207 start_codon:yes stop_codon:yes gene_type:complete
MKLTKDFMDELEEQAGYYWLCYNTQFESGFLDIGNGYNYYPYEDWFSPDKNNNNLDQYINTPHRHKFV